MAGAKPPFTVRRARREDAASLRELIAHSVRVLESPDDSRDYAGFGRCEMTATLTGLRMYLA